MASHTISHRKKRAFLAAFAECGNVTEAADSVGIHRRTHYDWLANDPDYAAAFAEAEDEAVDRLETEARRRAVEGVRNEKSHYFKGDLVGVDVETKYSDTLLIFLLKALRPEKYRERFETKHVGEVHHTHAVDWTGLTDDELDLLAGIAERAAGSGDDPAGTGAT